MMQHDPVQPIGASVAPAPAAVSGTALSNIGLFAFVVVAWAMNWVVMKVAVREIAPVWAVAYRTIIAASVVFPALLASGQLILPPRRDLPIVAVIAMFHMVGFAALMAAGLTFVPAGRAVLLGYTVPLWVAPAAYLFLRERIALRQVIGIAIGLAGLLLLTGQMLLTGQSSSHQDGGKTLLGEGLVIVAAVSWSVSIVYTRAHRWTATPLQLLPWQCLLATAVLVPLALVIEGAPPLRMSPPAMLALVYNGAIGTALGFWAMTVVGRRVPATTAALGVLATPVVGIGLSAAMLGEGLDPVLLLSTLVVLVGIAIGSRG